MKQLALALVIVPNIAHAYFSPTLPAITHPRDLQYITNLAYWSYQRHRANYKAQKAAFENLHNSWHLWHNTTKLCLNPAHCPLLTQNTSTLKKPSDILEQQRKTSAAYSNMLTHSMHATQSIPAREYITHMRSQARYKSARVILHYLFTHAVELLHKTRIPKTLGDISAYGALIFGKTDKNYTHVSDTLWQKFIITQKLHHDLWLSIEQARAHFYLKQYTQCFAALHALTQEREYHTLIIHEHIHELNHEYGITLDSRSTVPLLPHPEQITQQIDK